ncbi:MAG: DUF2399 domain-containing protein [Bacilli bacterium]|nr:DUF2399 domain-containing protein [Bacilli bacterium]
MRHEQAILSKLLDKFENSQQAWGKVPNGKKPRKISLYVDKDPVFSSYWGEDCYLHRESYEQAVSALEQKDFVIAKKDRDSGLLMEVILIVDHIDEAFAYLKREKKRDRTLSDRDYVKRLLSENGETEIVKHYLSDIFNALKENKSLSSPLPTRQELELLVHMIVAMLSQKESILLRNFSKRNFKDSKVFERHGERLLSIFRKYGHYESESFRALCEEFHIFSNPEIAMVKGPMSFNLHGQMVDLKKLGVPFSFTSEGIEDMEVVSLDSSRVITIENLTTFHYFDDPNSLVIYLGGYHNTAIRTLLNKIKCRSSKMIWLHTGDIDWGGFNILLDLRAKTSLPFAPYHMGILELQEYKDECKPLSDQDRINLNSLSERPESAEFSDTIKYMLEHGFKLEQESIEYDPKHDFGVIDY